MLFSLGSKLSRKTNLGHLFIISAKKPAIFCLLHDYIWHITYLLHLYYAYYVQRFWLCVFFKYMHTNISDKISSLLNEKLYPRMQCARLDLPFPAWWISRKQYRHQFLSFDQSVRHFYTKFDILLNYKHVVRSCDHNLAKYCLWQNNAYCFTSFLKLVSRILNSIQ